MKLTKKQITTMQRIIKREQGVNEKYKRGPAGLHPSGDHFAVTDGFVAVIIDEKPEGLEEAPRNDHCDQYVSDAFRGGNGVLMDADAVVNSCKQAIQDWRQSKEYAKPPYAVVTLSAIDERSGKTLQSCFNAQYVLDALNAVGTGAMPYIGMDEAHNIKYPVLMVYRKNWMDGNDNLRALVLPRRAR